jgi:hypothetical protein
MHQHARDGDMADLPPRPGRAHHEDHGHQYQQHAGKAQQQEGQRRRLRQAELGHDKSRTPQEYEKQRYGRQEHTLRTLPRSSCRIGHALSLSRANGPGRRLENALVQRIIKFVRILSMLPDSHAAALGRVNKRCPCATHKIGLT